MRMTFVTVSLLALMTAMPGPILAETAAATDTTTETAALPAISVVSVAKRTVADHILASGLISAVETVNVAPLIEGQQIESLDADVGDTVAAGQVLAKLSTATWELQQSQLKATLASATTQAAEAQKTADRSAALLKQGSMSISANDQAQAAAIAAQAQVDTLKAQMANVELQLSRASVVTPVAGLITSRNAQLGGIASAAGQPMFTLIRDGALELRADVAEADLPRVAKGQTATLQLAAGVPPLTGTVRLVEPALDTVTRLGRARITLDTPAAVHPGMYAEADILVASHDALAVPVTAVGSEGSETTVMLVKDGVIHRTVVTTGIRDGGWIEILTGLSAGDQIVAKAGAFVADGDKINPVQATN